MLRTAVTFVYCTLAVLTACESPVAPSRGAEPELERLPRSLSIAETDVIGASNRFAFDILRETVRQQPEPNTFLSPLSASMALGMTMTGARGETLAGMRRALGFEEIELEAIQRSYRDLIDLLRGLDDNVDMRIANSIWARLGIPFHETFMQGNRDYFDAHTATLDFASRDAAVTINRWVEENTGGKIKKIVGSTEDAVMYLINAIYFKGDWRQRFDRAQTRDAPFTLADGSKKTVPMMNRLGTVLYHGDQRVQIVELLYGRSAFAMTLVLPAEDTDLEAFIASLDAQQWQQWTDALHATTVRLSLPRFRIEYTTVLNEPLIELGMESAFGVVPGTDFTGMSPAGKSLFISKVTQKTYVDVNEEGTEAAAATSVEIGITSVGGQPPTVVVDRPFLVALRERFSGTILFLGRIGEP